MNILRKTLLVLITPLFFTLLVATAVDYGFVHTATHPATVKKLVADSGVYSSIVPSILNQNQAISTTLGDLSTSDPAVKAAATAAVSPQFLKTNTEAAIDSIYAWLDGKTTIPTFNVDLGGAKDSFANALATNVQQHLASLPACTSTAQANSFDVLNASCLPAGVTPAAAAAQVKDSALSGQGFLNQTSINANSIKNGDNNQPVFTDQLKNLPKQYQWAKKTPYILALAAVLVGAAIVFLSTTWRRGLKHIGITLAVAGGLMLAFAYGVSRIAASSLVDQIKIDNAALQTDVRTIITDLLHLIDKNYWYFGAIYGILGAAVLIYLWYSGRELKAPPKAPKAKPADV